MTFVTGFKDGRFTLTSAGISGNPNVEEFTDVKALDHKIEVLEENGHNVHTSPAVKPTYKKKRFAVFA